MSTSLACDGLAPGMQLSTLLGGLTCDCGSADLFAVEPGTDAETAADLFTLTRPKPMRCWCAQCWPHNPSRGMAADTHHKERS